MARIIAVFIAVITLALLAGAAQAAGIRHSVSPETVRVVLDLPAEAMISDRLSATAITVTTNAPLAEAMPAVTFADPIVTGAALAPDANGMATLTITLARARKYKLFTLPAQDGKPFRVVVDVLKRFAITETRAITPAIRYTRVEEQTDARYLAMHVLEVNARDPKVRLRVEAAQGERETVAAMAARTGAVSGVNGGYFLTGTRPVGLLKVEGQVRSLPLWGRTALAIANDRLPVLANPCGSWQVTLPDGTTRDLPDYLNASVQIPPPASTVVAGTNFAKPPANPAGLTVVVRGGKVLPATSAITLERDDFALLLAGDAATTLGPLLAEGAAVSVTPVITPAWTEFPNAIGAGPRLLRGGKVEVTGEKERFKADILYGRPARTGLGITADGRIILLVVEAPQPYGGGATLEELANLLRARGAVDAINLDGGGSSSLALNGATVNYAPGTWVRPVASSVLVFDDRYTPPAVK